MAKRRKTRAVSFGFILFCALSISAAHLSAGAQAGVGADWQAEWKKTLAAAKKEGQVSVYSLRYERVFQEFRQMENWLAQGKYSVCLGCRNILRAKHQGLPVDQFEASTWKEGVYIAGGGGTLTLLKQGPHSNAAKVLINWYLSRKGQMALQKLGEPDNPPNSGRIDIPKDDVPVPNRAYEGTRYFDVGKPEFADMKPILDLVEEIMRANELGR